MKVSRKKKNKGSSTQAKGKRRFLRSFGWMYKIILNTATVIMLILFIVSAYSDLVSPQKSVVFAYLGLGFPIIVVLNFICLILQLFARRWLFVTLIIIGIIVCIGPLWRYCPMHPLTDIPKDGDVVKLLSYNVMGFGYRSHSSQKPNKIIEYIAASGADIVCLQEYLVYDNGVMMSSEELAKSLPMYPYISETPLGTHSKNHKYGLALLSKFPITKTRPVPLISQFNGSVIYHLNVHGKNLVLVNNHLESFKLTIEDRSKISSGVLETLLPDGFGKMIQQKLGQAFCIRATQADVISDMLRSEKGGYYVIACGDFNDTPMSYTHHVFSDFLNDAYTETGLGPGISYNQNRFYFRIDHIFHSATIEAYNCRVDRSIFDSDHFPISCTLKLK
ncbi:MAG: endonuclease/exonuclease/phosphatase family protein [Tannerella sp.]|jgi:endonuclease/exonuclease/phosphatase family metal-dependent hydrolase|nr:endonuclease/exonuclease/phosphatase family protein [Tannerella sp.]